ncbi:patatin [Burkholderia cepacia]|uniref:Patatin n=1 Tax=Burkholderia cepacia TaxID=292 RepID=A0AAX2RQA9_BURCE|nr:CBASS cGAMP-activated phospholipase [Burkholderia cepacia]TES79054.1 patatin [Burkholderia cepacia]TET01103.1 patatin [Burkholderia cepacia]TEU46115.1 patatin [Burkholderia cepacia]TEU47805.1 patatin [Burkholderia cepacia]TEU51188.1 patatin [Burkholderia cepacia]
MDKAKPRFQVLALSGGGYRGLFTARILAEIERQIEAPIGSRFDLITGTSIGGILALAVALEIPAQRMVELFQQHGEVIFRKRFSVRGFFRSQYSSDALFRYLSGDDVFGQRVIGECLHPVIVPAINYTRGLPVVFKTPHHADFKTDHRHRIVDVAMATSAAPIVFPRYFFNDCQYVDGGLFANAPGLLGVHEAYKFFGVSRAESDVRVLSIGTMSSKFTVNPKRNRSGGTIDWGGWWPVNAPKRLFGLSISAQEAMTNKVLEHQFPEGKYVHIDDVLTDERAQAVALDKADAAAREVLLGSAAEAAKDFVGSAAFKNFMDYTAASPVYHYGPRANILKVA